ncbi:hypothetical protein L6452_05857 [Arctium lappa]|uniref:Uncharacterized protein n=1 Tax=Arctium lappa TaxID=4217 RepID=A0ACB9EI86_ARCLA|nr:hypothetical protein L6452_05857 [Arctium lappa]
MTNEGRKGRRACSYKSFLCIKPPEFSGSDNPIACMNWTQEIEQVFDACECEEGQKLSWTEFKKKVMEEYCNEKAIDRIEEEFRSLKKGNLSTSESKPASEVHSIDREIQQKYIRDGFIKGTYIRALKTLSLKIKLKNYTSVDTRTEDTSLSDKIFFQAPSFQNFIFFFANMANSSISAIYTTGSLTKSPTLLRDEYPQWKIRMVNFLEGMDRDLMRSVNEGPHQPMVLVPRVPATATTADIFVFYEKKTSNFTEEEKN